MRRRRQRKQSEVELNLAAMLDMAFQLLTFFILTFKPAPIEGQVSLRLPPPQPVTNVKSGQQAGADTSNTNPVAGLDTLVVSVFAKPSGGIEALAIGEGNVANLQELEARLKVVLSDPGSGFKQVIVQVGSDLRYEELMRVIDICTRQKLPGGERLTKLSFVELPNAPAAP
ncbi:MAG: ExbD/TolR family protein [Pirellulales bacterium]